MAWGGSHQALVQKILLFFQMGGVVLSLYPSEKLAEDVKTNSGDSGFSGITLAYNAKREAEVDEVLKR